MKTKHMKSLLFLVLLPLSFTLCQAMQRTSEFTIKSTNFKLVEGYRVLLNPEYCFRIAEFYFDDEDYEKAQLYLKFAASQKDNLNIQMRAHNVLAKMLISENNENTQKSVRGTLCDLRKRKRQDSPNPGPESEPMQLEKI